jgi:hypothetical protein
MTVIIDRMTGVSMSGTKLETSTEIIARHPADPVHRVVTVNRQALALFAKAKLDPPLVGQFELAALDAKLAASSLTTGERMECKAHLRDCGLLAIGRPIDTRVG